MVVSIRERRRVDVDRGESCVLTALQVKETSMEMNVRGRSEEETIKIRSLVMRVCEERQQYGGAEDVDDSGTNVQLGRDKEVTRMERR
mmetsp:Transcript_16392/g.33406  ORF Transcript_16392/g.33406 Transcript_16392/m.33406 type:complete len:88 (+) Transcript_16392:670-933(+)